MRLELVFHDIKPISLNHCHKITTRGRFPSKYKTKEYIAFESKINSQISSFKSQIRKLNSAYKEDTHYMVVDYRFYYPIMTKAGTISKRSNDVDNIIKPINDIIFKHLSTDDSQVMSVASTKIHSDQLKIEMYIQIKLISHIN